MQRLQLPAGTDDFQCQFDVFGENFAGFDGIQTGISDPDSTAEEFTRVGDQKIVHIDHRATARSDRQNGHVQQDCVGEQTFYRGFRFGITGGPDIQIRG